MARPNESELVVPLRKAWSITRFKRAPRAMQIIKDHVIQHLKVQEDEEVWIDPSVNEHIWSRGIENPPRKVRFMLLDTMNQIFQSRLNYSRSDNYGKY